MKKILLALTLISIALLGNAQVVRIQFEECDLTKMQAISKAVSIDQRDGCLYTAYANPRELAAFEALGIPYEIAPDPEFERKATITAATSIEQMAGWNYYPSYSTYVQMMQNWAATYPNICKLDTIGNSYNGHKLLCLKISDNPQTVEAEPEFLYMSSMHGDEVTGFYFLLRMIDTLLTSYGTNTELTNLVNTTQLYICPDANPDGTYKGGDNYIYKPSNSYDYSGRYNGNGEDLNRTYPDPFSSTAYQTQYNATEVENKAMIQYMNSHHFVMAACMHGGSEILNFPWDTYTSSQKSLADAAWWTAMGNRFLNTLRTYTGAPNSRTFPNNMYYGTRINGSYAGQCFGGDWYAISGGWQDYSNWYNHIRAFTVEVSNTKCPSVSGTQGAKAYWGYQKEPLMNLIKEVHQGVNGFVVDSVTREPLKAFIEVVNHDRDSSQIYSREGLGDYYRPIADGTYSFRASAPGYTTKTYTNVTAAYGTPTNLLIELVPVGWVPVNYMITAVSDNAQMGSVTGSGTYVGGTTATLTATANAGYQFTQWNDGNTTNPRSFTVTSDSTFTAYFEAATYTITATSGDATMGTVTGGGSYTYGQTATLTATANTHYHFVQWNDGNTQNPRMLTVMSDASYIATFAGDNYTLTVNSSNPAYGTAEGGGSYSYGTTATLTATPNEGYSFTGWNDGNTNNPRTVTVTGNATYTANFEAGMYVITATANNAAYGTVNGGGSYSYGQTATLTATPNTGYHFAGWNDGNMQNPRTITVTGNANYTANFAINTYTIAITPNNAAYGSTTGSGTYAHGETVTASATAFSGYVFDRWSNGETGNPYTFAATQDLSLTAYFAEEAHVIVYYTLTVTANDGAMGQTSGSGVYEENSIATLSATANNGYYFVQWSDGNTDNPRTVTVTGNAAYTAIFAAQSYNVSVTPNNAAYGSTTGSGSYTYGSTAAISAIPNNGYRFLNWNDGNTATERNITVTRDMNFIATFAPERYDIIVNTNNATYGTTAGTGTYNYGEQITISAIPNNGIHFVGWNDGNTDNPRTITVTGDATYTATMATDSYTLTVVPDDEAHGSASGSGVYNYGETVSLEAAANTGYSFVRWSDGNTYAIRTVTVTEDATYTAYFEANEYTIIVSPNSDVYGTTTGSGSYHYGETVTATATAYDGVAVFDHWSDGTTDNPYTFEVTRNLSLRAIFVPVPRDDEGIEEAEATKFTLYPNPTTGLLHIQYDGAADEEMVLMNMYGQILQKQAAGATTIDITDYPRGTYFLRIGTHTTKVVKM